MNLRPYQPRDLPVLFRICLATAAAGADASKLYRDPLLVGHVFAAPYAILAPECCLVTEDRDGVGGYIVGATDTAAFEARLETEWWPQLRDAYPDPPACAAWESTLDPLIMRLIHGPVRTPGRIAGPYPAHLHINLLPRLQGRGRGRALIDRWLERMRERGSHGAHLAVGLANARAIAFYHRYGFRELERSGRDGTIVWFGLGI